MATIDATAPCVEPDVGATAPHFYLQTEIDMSTAVEARARIKGMSAEDEVVLSFNDMVVKACALALRSFPYANGAYRDGRLGSTRG